MNEKYTIKIENFEGPFDLLFHLIEKNKIDIYDIPIALITEQYIEYIQAMQEMDLEVTSEFLVMAATLLHIKSRMLLPKKAAPENEEEAADPREELVARLLEYKKYKEFAQDLKEREKVYQLVYYKLPETIKVENKNTQLIGLNIEDLVLAFKKVLDKETAEKSHNKTAFSQILVRDKVSVAKKIRDISRLLKDKKNMKFTDIFDASSSKMEKVASFLAILELIKLKHIFIEQEQNFGEIIIKNIE